jgi:hypothetical protein
MTTSPSPAPSYCQLHVGAPLSPSQWTTCWNYGWHEPATLAARLGYDVGHNILPVLIIVAVVAFAIVKVFSRS